MRYIIIPLLIALYALWSYYSIKNAIKERLDPFWMESYSCAWVAIHLSTILEGIILLIVKYW